MARESDDSDEMYCERHNLREPMYPDTDPHCPYCREEQRIDAREMEMHARRADPNMHPSVDAPRR